MTVSKRLRFEVLRRDNHACRYCGRGAPEVRLTVDHVLPVTLGGTDDPANLVTACTDCNAGKSSVPADAQLVADVDADALRWSKAIAKATEIALAERERMNDVEKAVFAAFDKLEDYLPGDWYLAVQRFVAAGLDATELVDAAYIARYAKHVPLKGMWRYFCGICWRKVSDRQEAARAILTADEGTD